MSVLEVWLCLLFFRTRFPTRQRSSPWASSSDLSRPSATPASSRPASRSLHKSFRIAFRRCSLVSKHASESDSLPVQVLVRNSTRFSLRCSNLVYSIVKSLIVLQLMLSIYSQQRMSTTSNSSQTHVFPNKTSYRYSIIRYLLNPRKIQNES